MKMDKGVNLLEHINIFNKILDQLYKVDIKVEEEEEEEEE